jgi:hypothetical protein
LKLFALSVIALMDAALPAAAADRMPAKLVGNWCMDRTNQRQEDSWAFNRTTACSHSFWLKFRADARTVLSPPFQQTEKGATVAAAGRDAPFRRGAATLRKPSFGFSASFALCGARMATAALLNTAGKRGALEFLVSDISGTPNLIRARSPWTLWIGGRLQSFLAHGFVGPASLGRDRDRRREAR